MNDILNWVQEWYRSQCDGDWEHEYGVDIKTVDNPGWYIRINLKETDLEEKDFTSIRVNRNEMDWFFCLKKNNIFEASGGPMNLIEILQNFRNWVEKS